MELIDQLSVGDKLQFVKNPLELPFGAIAEILQIQYDNRNILVRFEDPLDGVKRELLSIENVTKYTIHMPHRNYAMWKCECGNSQNNVGPGHSAWCTFYRPD